MSCDSAMRYVSASSRLSGFPNARCCGLLGIQSCPPDHALVPPTVSAFSKSPTRAPPSKAAIAAVNPAAPVPNTTTSNSCIRCAPCIHDTILCAGTSVGENEVGCSPAESHRGRVGVAGRQGGHHRPVDDPQMDYSVDS